TQGLVPEVVEAGHPIDGGERLQEQPFHVPERDGPVLVAETRADPRVERPRRLLPAGPEGWVRLADGLHGAHRRHELGDRARGQRCGQEGEVVVPVGEGGAERLRLHVPPAAIRIQVRPPGSRLSPVVASAGMEKVTMPEARSSAVPSTTWSSLKATQ